LVKARAFTTSSTGGIGVGTNNRDLIINTVRGTLNVSARIGAVQASAGLLKAGAGTLVLSSPDNAYSQAVYVNEGVLRLASAAAAGTTAGGIVVQNNAALELTNSVAIANEALTITGHGVSNGGALRNVASSTSIYGGTVTIGDGGARINSDSEASLTLTNASGIVTAVYRDVTIGGSGDTTVSGLISGAGSLIKDGSGTLTLSGTNTYTGTTTINDGTLALGGHNVLNGKKITLNGGTLDAGIYTNTLSTLTVSGGASLVLNPGAVLAFADSSAIQWSGTVNLTGVFSAGTSLRFGTSSAGLTPAQLASLSAAGYKLSLDSNGYLTGRTSGTLILFM
jgi:fibronectin-binding autotransporter adhesin